MKRAHLPHALLVALLTFGFGSAVAKSGASGTVTIDGTAWPVADAVAVLDNEDLTIVFAKHAFDRVEWTEDGQFDSSDLFEFKDDAEAVSLTIDIDEEDGGYAGHTVRFSAGSMSGGYNSELEAGTALSARDEKHLAGTVKFDNGDGLAADVQFDLPITKAGPLPRAGTPLPADGGDPGKALKTMVDATHAGDLDKMISLSHPERRKGIEEAKAAGEADEMLKMAKLFTPKITKITGGTVDGDNAWVEFEGQEDGSAVKGTAELTRAGGKWYISSINTKSGS